MWCAVMCHEKWLTGRYVDDRHTQNDNLLPPDGPFLAGQLPLTDGCAGGFEFIYSLVQGGWPVGALVASGLSALLMPIIGWQGSFIFAAVPSFIIALLALKLKETPQILCADLILGR